MPGPVPSNEPPIGMALAGIISVAAGQVVAGHTSKQTVRVASTGNLDLSSTLVGASIDGVTVAVDDRVLVWQQTDLTENGIYIIATAPFRAPDFDSSAEIVGALVPVTAGTLYGGDIFQNTNLVPITVGTDDITFEILSTPPSGAAGGDFEGNFPNPTLKETSVRDIGHWEVVMEPGVTAPPVAVETPDQSDWVYGWLSG